MSALPRYPTPPARPADGRSNTASPTYCPTIGRTRNSCTTNPEMVAPSHLPKIPVGIAKPATGQPPRWNSGGECPRPLRPPPAPPGQGRGQPHGRLGSGPGRGDARPPPPPRARLAARSSPPCAPGPRPAGRAGPCLPAIAATRSRQLWQPRPMWRVALGVRPLGRSCQRPNAGAATVATHSARFPVTPHMCAYVCARPHVWGVTGNADECVAVAQCHR